MHVALSTLPAAADRPNEDFTAVALPAAGQGGCLVLLDGVTPPAEDYGCRHPVSWFTARLGGALGELSVSQRHLTLTEVLSYAIERTSKLHHHQCDLSHNRTPQATVVLARWDAERVEHLVLSDSVLLVERVNGTVEPVLDDRLARLPPGSLASAAIADATVRNREGGFFTAAADPSVAARAVTGTLPRAEVRALAALSDGASRWVETFRQGGWRDCLALLATEGPDALITRVRALEEADAADRALLGRAKPHDDASAVYVRL